MEAVDDATALENADRTILRMESDKSSVTSSTVLRRPSSIRCRTTITSSAPCNDGNQGLLPRAGLTVGHKRVQLTTRKRGFVDSQRRTDIVRKQQPSIRMCQLLPLPETAQHFLVLIFKRMSIYSIELLKRMAGHGDVFIRFF